MHAGSSSLTRDQTQAPGAQSLTHWTTREVPSLVILRHIPPWDGKSPLHQLKENPVCPTQYAGYSQNPSVTSRDPPVAQSPPKLFELPSPRQLSLLTLPPLCLPVKSTVKAPAHAVSSLLSPPDECGASLPSPPRRGVPLLLGMSNRLYFLFFFFFKICYLFTYLFIYFIYFWLHRVLVVAHGIFVEACGIFRCSAWVPGFRGSVVCGTQALQLRRASSVVVACRLSCPTGCGILVLRPGIEPASPALEGGFFITGPPGKSPNSLFNGRPLLICWPHPT